MKWAVVEGYRDDDPAGNTIGAALPKGGAHRRHRRALPFAEVADALATIKKSDAYDVDEVGDRVLDVDGRTQRRGPGMRRGTKSTLEALLGRSQLHV